MLTRLNFPLTVDYIHVNRYCSDTTGHEITWKAYPKNELTDRVVVVVDDILDDGVTLKAVSNYCQEAGAKKVYSAVLVDKQKPRGPDALIKADFTGLEAENRYLVGYGMDYQEYLRNMPGIYAIAKEFE